MDYESIQDSPANSVDKSPTNLVRLSDESEREDIGRYVVDSTDQDTSQSLISLSQAQEPVAGTARSSQSIIPHSVDSGSRTTGENPEIDDIVEVYLRQTRRGRRGRPVTRCGRVTEIKPNDLTRVKTDTCPRKFRKVLKIITCHSNLMTSIIVKLNIMTSNDTQSQSEHSRFRSSTDCLVCVVMEM